MQAHQADSPFLSIITVNYNSGSVLESTIQSVLGQSSSHFEYIIVDGDSTDNSKQIIDKYRKHIDQYISEKDDGLYDAMNKGMKLATGKYLWFLNAGDQIASDDVVEKLEDIHQDADILYSDTMVIGQDGTNMGLLSSLTHNNSPRQLSWKSMQRGMVVCHQSFLVKKDIAPPYQTSYRLSADIDWVIRCLKASEKNLHVGFIISKFLSGGLSKQNLKASMKERYTILRKHYGFFPNLINHIYILSRYLAKGRKSKLNTH